jgi:hypothetical protein
MRIARGVSPVRCKLGSRVLDTGCGPAQPGHVSLARDRWCHLPGAVQIARFRSHSQARLISWLQSTSLLFAKSEHAGGRARDSRSGRQTALSTGVALATASESKQAPYREGVDHQSTGSPGRVLAALPHARRRPNGAASLVRSMPCPASTARKADWALPGG